MWYIETFNPYKYDLLCVAEQVQVVEQEQLWSYWQQQLQVL